MKAFIRVVLFVVIGVSLLLLGSCLGIIATGTQNGHWNQRLTLVIETATGPVSGAVVQRIDWQGTRGLCKFMTSGVDASSASVKVTGEALAIGVMPDRWLFTLLKGGDGWISERCTLLPTCSYGRRHPASIGGRAQVVRCSAPYDGNNRHPFAEK